MNTTSPLHPGTRQMVWFSSWGHSWYADPVYPCLHVMQRATWGSSSV